LTPEAYEAVVDYPFKLEADEDTPELVVATVALE
jgi:hypothetical protein